METAVTVQRRFPVFAATVHTNRSCDDVRSQIGGVFDGNSFTIHSHKHGFQRGLKHIIDGRISTGEGGGCDVAFEIRYPTMWWVLAAALVIGLIHAMPQAASSRELYVLILCLALLLAIGVFGLPLKGAGFARKLCG